MDKNKQIVLDDIYRMNEEHRYGAAITDIANAVVDALPWIPRVCWGGDDSLEERCVLALEYTRDEDTPAEKVLCLNFPDENAILIQYIDEKHNLFSKYINVSIDDVVRIFDEFSGGGNVMSVMRNISAQTNQVASSDSSPNPISHPPHYTTSAYECLDEMLALFGEEAVIGFCKCNVYKYRYRANAKNGEEDLHKADEYMRICLCLQEGKEWKKKE